MKMSKEDLKKKVNDSLPDNIDLATSLLEDIEDSMEESTGVAQEEFDKIKKELAEVKQKYHDRFLTGSEEKKEDKEEFEEEEKKDEVIDVKEII